MAASSAPRPAGTIAPVPFRARLYGFGSIYGKTLRDSRLSIIIAAGLLGGMAMLMGAALPQVFPTPQARLEVDKLIAALPANMVNLFGKPVGLGTLGGYMTWKYGAIFVMGTTLWSIMALAGTLAAEARRGSLDIVATTPMGKARIALEKLLAHITAITIVAVVLAVASSAGSQIFGDAALGDTIPLLGGFGFALWIWAIALFFSSFAFLLSPVLGKGGAAGVTSLLMVTLWLANGLQGMDALAAISPFRWTQDHIPLVGQYDWAPVLLTIGIGIVFRLAGILLFVRRDLGVTAGLEMPKLPSIALGVRGPTARAFADMAPRAIAWGLGLALMGAMVSSLNATMVEQLKSDPKLLSTFQAIFPDFDLGSSGGWLQLYVQLLSIAFGFAATTFVSKWTSDETDDRLETVLATPLPRWRWVVSGGIAALVSALVTTAFFALGLVGGASGMDATQPVLGTSVLFLYSAAVVGVGFAIGGLFGTSKAPEIAALLVVATYLLDLVGAPLALPEWLRGLALTTHLGEPMVGTWDAGGMLLCAAIAVGGVALGAFGMRRRDVAR